jgi:hypothetical protein
MDHLFVLKSKCTGGFPCAFKNTEKIMKKLLFLLLLVKILWGSNDSLYIDLELAPTVAQHTFLFPGITKLYEIPHIDEIKYKANFKNYLYISTEINIQLYGFFSRLRIDIPTNFIEIAKFNQLSYLLNKDGNRRYFLGYEKPSEIFVTNIPRKIREIPQNNYYLELSVNRYKNLNIGIWLESGGTRISEEGVSNPAGIALFDSLHIGSLGIKNQLIGLIFKFQTGRKNWKGKIFLKAGILGNYKVEYTNDGLFLNKLIQKKYNLSSVSVGIQFFWQKVFFLYKYKKFWVKNNLYTDNFHFLSFGFRMNLVKMKINYSSL